MPNQSHSGFEKGPWHRCDRCGMEYPAPLLARQNGLILCTVKCIDDLLTFERDELIRQLLEQNEHEMDVMEILKEVTDDATIQPDES